MLPSPASPPSRPARGRRARSRLLLVVLGSLVAAGILARAGDVAFHRLWPFQPYRDELARVGPPLPGATLLAETTSGFPYGCLDQCPSVSAEWHLRQPISVDAARRSVVSRLAARGYVAESPPLACRGPGEPPAGVQCIYLFHTPGFDYGVRLELGFPPVRPVPSLPSPGTGTGAEGSGPVLGIQTWVMPG